VLLTDLEKQRAFDGLRSPTTTRGTGAIRRYGELEERFVALGGYSAESEAGRICASLGLAERVLTQQLQHTVRGGSAAGWSWRGSCSPLPIAVRDLATTLLLDEPTNHLDADSLGWLAGFPAVTHRRAGGLSATSVDLIADVVNRVWFLDAVRGEVDVLQHGLAKSTWTPGPPTSSVAVGSGPTPNARPHRCARRPPKLGAKATKATAAQNMLRRADRMMAELDEERVADRVARIKFPVSRRMRTHTPGGQGD